MPTDGPQANDTSNETKPARLGKSPPKLSYFCVYNPSLAQSEENTKDQILYYTAEKVVPADVKMKQVGLAQALVNFTSAFHVSQPAQNVHTQKNRMVFLQPEPGFWMHMCVELGISRKRIKDSKSKEKLVTEYMDAQLNDRALEAVLKVGYEQFKLLNGTFSSILYGDANPDDQHNRQRARSLMHSIEEFFSDWIWKWDFDNLARMMFSAVFYGVPTQPVLRPNYLRINKLDESIHTKYNKVVSHIFVQCPHNNSLVYRSPSLNIKDVRSLRRFVSQLLDEHADRIEAQKKLKHEREQALKKDAKMGGFKSFATSLSQSHILSYFTSQPAPSSSTNAVADASIREPPSTLPNPSDDLTTPSSPVSEEILRHGVFLPASINRAANETEGESLAPNPEIVRVFLSSGPALDDIPSGEGSKETQMGGESLTEYFLLVYKHKSGLLWVFLLDCTGSDVDQSVLDPLFYTGLEKFMIEQQLDSIVSAVQDDILASQQKELSLGKRFRCFYYDNATLNVKSTMPDRQSQTKTKDTTSQGDTPLSNDILLQLLELKDDFERLPRTSEVYTRSVSNYWIAGRRLYNKAAYSKDSKQNRRGDADADDRSSVQSLADNPMDDYTELYLVASKKDTSLADVEENLSKMTLSLQEVTHLE